MDKKQFGAYIRALRIKKGLKGKALASEANISSPYLSQIENGTVGIPSALIIKKLAKPLAVDYRYLMKEAGYLEEEVLEVIEKRETKIELLKVLRQDYPHSVCFAGRELTEKEKHTILQVMPLLLFGVEGALGDFSAICPINGK